jgi:hypothetical protein
MPWSAASQAGTKRSAGRSPRSRPAGRRSPGRVYPVDTLPMTATARPPTVRAAVSAAVSIPAARPLITGMPCAASPVVSWRAWSIPRGAGCRTPPTARSPLTRRLRVVAARQPGRPTPHVLSRPAYRLERTFAGIARIVTATTAGHAAAHGDVGGEPAAGARGFRLLAQRPRGRAGTCRGPASRG